MYAVATFIVVAILSLAFTKLAAGALIATGLPPGVATFQARSAFSGAGFTTSEAENVVNHPARRKIIGVTMFVGNLGTPTLVVTVLVGFLGPGPGNTVERTMVAVSGLLLAIMLVLNGPTQRALVKIGQHQAQTRLLPYLDEQVVELFAVADDYVLGSLRVTDEPGPMVRSLRGIDEALATVQVLGVRQVAGEYLGAPPVDVELEVGDEIVVYGRRTDVQHAVDHHV